MAGQVYLAPNRQTFNRLLDGPTWGITRASQALAKLAKTNNLQSEQIWQEIDKHAVLTKRLALLGFEFDNISQGTSSREIAKVFRLALYGRTSIERTFSQDGFSFSFRQDLVSDFYEVMPLKPSFWRIEGTAKAYNLQEELDSFLGLERKDQSQGIIARYVFPVLGLLSPAVLLPTCLGQADNRKWFGLAAVLFGLNVGRLLHLYFYREMKQELALDAMGVLVRFSKLPSEKLDANSVALARKLKDYVGGTSLSGYLAELDMDKRVALTTCPSDLPLRLPDEPAERLAYVKDAVLKRDGRQLLTEFLPQMDNNAMENLFGFLDLETDKGNPWARDNLSFFVGVIVKHPATPTGLLDIIAGGAFGDREAIAAMDRIIEEGKVNQACLSCLKNSKTTRVSLQAYFYDQTSTAEELAQALVEKVGSDYQFARELMRLIPELKRFAVLRNLIMKGALYLKRELLSTIQTCKP